MTFSPIEAGCFFFQRPPQNHPKISFFLIYFYIFLLIFGSKLQKIQISGFRFDLGCAPNAQILVFFFTSSNRSLAVSCRKFEFQVLGVIWGAHHTPEIGCFFKIFKIHVFLLFYYSAYKKAAEMVFIWGDRGYPAVRFEYKTASEWYLVAEL